MLYYSMVEYIEQLPKFFFINGFEDEVLSGKNWVDRDRMVSIADENHYTFNS
jgi:hypothetical protein